MKKILIATTNKDKYKIVKYLLARAGLNEAEYMYQSLEDISYNGADKKEQGSIEMRAEMKARAIKEYLKDNDYEYIIGIDDGIYIKGGLQENIKDYIKKILYENYLSNGEEYAFYRAYCVITKDGEVFKTETKIPYSYKAKENAELKPNSYPLSQISVPVGYDKALTDLSEDEANEYTWNNSKEKIIELIRAIKMQ
ncbi:MAG: hypothetical protein IJH12_05725 [Clostridia bacterium]|nr:hypothetical protein [Clostridia bacterium]